MTRSRINISDVQAYSQYTPPAEYKVFYLVVASGGGGNTSAYNDGSGGGAGGYRTNWKDITTNTTYQAFINESGRNSPPEPDFLVKVGTTYTVTVGAGGSVNGGRGNQSVFGPIISAGGGGGGSHRSRGRDGGSGSGGGGLYSNDTVTGGYGNYGQGFNGGTKTNYPGGGGGGGAGGAGGGGSGDSKNGGIGLQSNITGSLVYRAGGGGNHSGSGGAGGGANGGGGSGTANSGGGGAGNQNNGGSGSGGSGVVILRMLTSDYSGTTTGSPTVTTSGSDTILTFNSSGSYTA